MSKIVAVVIGRGHGYTKKSLGRKTSKLHLFERPKRCTNLAIRSSSPYVRRLIGAQPASLLFDSGKLKAPPVVAAAKSSVLFADTCRTQHASDTSRTLQARRPSSAPSNRKTSAARRTARVRNNGTFLHLRSCRGKASTHIQIES